MTFSIWCNPEGLRPGAGKKITSDLETREEAELIRQAYMERTYEIVSSEYGINPVLEVYKSPDDFGSWFKVIEDVGS